MCIRDRPDRPHVRARFEDEIEPGEGILGMYAIELPELSLP